MNLTPLTPSDNCDADLDAVGDAREKPTRRPAAKVVGSGACVLPVPAVCAELPDELRVKLPGGALTKAERISPPLLEPRTCSQQRLWDALGSHTVIVNRAFGVSQTGPSTRARTDEELAVDTDWNILDGHRSVPMRNVGAMPTAAKGHAATRVSVPVEDVLTLVPEHLRDAFDVELTPLFPSGKVPGKVADRLDDERIAMHNAGRTPEEFVRYGIGNALDQDRKVLGHSQRKMCGAWTKERRVYGRGREGRILRRMFCLSDRCPRCARIRAAREAAKIQAQVDSDLAAGRDNYVMLTVTLAPKGHQNPATACRVVLNGKHGPWRRVRKWLRRHYPGMAYFRVVEFHANGFPHLHVLIRSKAMVDEMLVEAGLDSVDALRARVTEVSAENARRKAAGIVGRLRCPYSKLKAVVRKAVVAAGWGRDAFDFDLLLHPNAIGAELAKASQVLPAMPRLRRFQPSVRNKLGRGIAFFDKGAREQTVEATVPPVDCTMAAPSRGGLTGTVEVKYPEGAPKLRIGADVTPGPGRLRVRIETVTTDECRSGERLVLQLRILEPEVFAHGRLRCTVPFAYGDDLIALLRNVLGLVHLNDQRFFEPKWLLGQEAWVHFEPRGALDAKTGEPLRWPRFDWAQDPLPTTEVAAEVKNLVPTQFMDDAATPTEVDGDLVEHSIHFAPIEKVVEAYAKGRQERFCGARVEAAWDEAEGTVVRRLVACQEALRERYGIEAVADLLDQLVALQALGPPEVLEINDLPAIIAGVRAFMAELAAQKADTA